MAGAGAGGRRGRTRPWRRTTDGRAGTRTPGTDVLRHDGPTLRRGALLSAVAVILSSTAACSAAQDSPAPVTSWNKHLTAVPVRATLPRDPRQHGWRPLRRGDPGGRLARRRVAGRQPAVHRQAGDPRNGRPAPHGSSTGQRRRGPGVRRARCRRRRVAGRQRGRPGHRHGHVGERVRCRGPADNFTCLHIEIDGTWRAAGWAPPDFPLDVPIDVQGYLYWDVPHVEEGVPQDSATSGYVLGHYGTGWEIHPGLGLGGGTSAADLACPRIRDRGRGTTSSRGVRTARVRSWPRCSERTPPTRSAPRCRPTRRRCARSAGSCRWPGPRSIR